MKFHDLQQRSQEWIDFRMCHITSTDASAIIGTNPYMSAAELFDLKMGLSPPIEENDAMRRGSALEGEALAVLCREKCLDFNPAVVTHDIESWMMASLDGISTCRKYIAEIKCPGIKNHEAVIRGDIPEYWITQCQHHLKSTEVLACYFMSYRPEHKTPFHIIKIEPDEPYIEKMIALEKEFFYENLCKIKRPEEPWKLNVC